MLILRTAEATRDVTGLRTAARTLRSLKSVSVMAGASKVTTGTYLPAAYIFAIFDFRRLRPREAWRRLRGRSSISVPDDALNIVDTFQASCYAVWLRPMTARGEGQTT